MNTSVIVFSLSFISALNPVLSNSCDFPPNLKKNQNYLIIALLIIYCHKFSLRKYFPLCIWSLVQCFPFHFLLSGFIFLSLDSFLNPEFLKEKNLCFFFKFTNVCNFQGFFCCYSTCLLSENISCAIPILNIC